MMKKYNIICSDPCWDFNDTLKMEDVKRGASSQYPTLNVTEIKKLPVQQISDPEGCLLALWVPSSLLQEGLDVMKAWGFQHKQTFIWVKIKKEESLKSYLSKKFKDLTSKITNKTKNKDNKDFSSKDFDISFNELLSFGMGRLFRQSHEVCLIGINNTGIYKKLKNKSQRSVSFFENKRHSEKPEDLQDRLELMFPDANKLEMFARRIRKDWTCLGNEVCDGEDIRDSLLKLL